MASGSNCVMSHLCNKYPSSNQHCSNKVSQDLFRNQLETYSSSSSSSGLAAESYSAATDNKHNYSGDCLSPEHPQNYPLIPVNEDGVDKYYCHLCSYSDTSKSHLYEHIDSHFEFKCDKCDYTSRTEGRLKRHILKFHEISSDAEQATSEGQQNETKEADEASSEQLSPSSAVSNKGQARQKIYRCKQCDFTATVKIEFWNHARIHIKEDKLLQCPKCPFVTEYKHHLEYHLRNHFGSKPFKCTKCNYSCVNKSMLNSHMKSHTNIYQYRCADCTYATKYCHSLKLHLRKYNHKPASILNMDGTVDHDTSALLTMKRSGPKGSKLKEEPTYNGSDSTVSPLLQSDSPKFPASPPIFPFWPLAPGGVRLGTPNVLPSFHVGSFFPGYMPPFVRAPIYPVQDSKKIFPFNKDIFQTPVRQSTQSLSNDATMAPNEDVNAQLNGRKLSLDSIAPRVASGGSDADKTSTSTATESLTDSSTAPETPLDLTKSAKRDTCNSPNESGSLRKRSRKGKAYKLDELCLKLQKTKNADDDVHWEADKKPSTICQEDNTIVDEDFVDVCDKSSNDIEPVTPEQNNNQVFKYKATPSPLNLSSTLETRNDLNTSPNLLSEDTSDYRCSYCDISFTNYIMHKLHMGYHGYNDPFKCNMCGEKSNDKISFFLHIARAPHP